MCLSMPKNRSCKPVQSYEQEENWKQKPAQPMKHHRIPIKLQISENRLLDTAIHRIAKSAEGHPAYSLR